MTERESDLSGKLEPVSFPRELAKRQRIPWKVFEHAFYTGLLRISEIDAVSVAERYREIRSNPPAEDVSAADDPILKIYRDIQAARKNSETWRQNHKLQSRVYMREYMRNRRAVQKPSNNQDEINS